MIKYIFILIFLGIISLSCKAQNKNKMITSGLIVEKEFVNKIGKSAGFKEMYFRLSVQDYFIKFCESKVSKEELKEYLEKHSTQSILGDKSITLEVEVVEGAWDICDYSERVQSRIGKYVIIHRIVK